MLLLLLLLLGFDGSVGDVHGDSSAMIFVRIESLGFSTAMPTTEVDRLIIERDENIIEETSSWKSFS